MIYSDDLIIMRDAYLRNNHALPCTIKNILSIPNKSILFDVFNYSSSRIDMLYFHNDNIYCVEIDNSNTRYLIVRLL